MVLCWVWYFDKSRKSILKYPSIYTGFFYGWQIILRSPILARYLFNLPQKSSLLLCLYQRRCPDLSVSRPLVGQLEHKNCKYLYHQVCMVTLAQRTRVQITGRVKIHVDFVIVTLHHSRGPDVVTVKNF